MAICQAKRQVIGVIEVVGFFFGENFGLKKQRKGFNKLPENTEYLQKNSEVD